MVKLLAAIIPQDPQYATFASWDTFCRGRPFEHVWLLSSGVDLNLAVKVQNINRDAPRTGHLSKLRNLANLHCRFMPLVLHWVPGDLQSQFSFKISFSFRNLSTSGNTSKRAEYRILLQCGKCDWLQLRCRIHSSRHLVHNLPQWWKLEPFKTKLHFRTWCPGFGCYFCASSRHHLWTCFELWNMSKFLLFKPNFFIFSSVTGMQFSKWFLPMATCYLRLAAGTPDRNFRYIFDVCMGVAQYIWIQKVKCQTAI